VFALIFVAYYAKRARSIDRLMLGSEAAWLLGEPVRRLRVELLVLACLATALAVSLAGAIGFVGLVVPQALRLVGVQHSRTLAWQSALGGAALLSLADTVARTVAWPLELPVGAVMALVGAPLFIVLLARGRA
jgi:iron complex transport system permease protein